MTSPSAIDVFVSYARADRDRVGPFVERLEAAGLAVWWDSRIVPGAGFDNEIQQALDGSRCVLVFWSQASVDSDWVITEAADGLERDVLVPVSIDRVRLPLAFRRRQTMDVTGSDAAVDHVLAAVQAVLEGGSAADRPQPRLPRRRPLWLGAAALALVAALTLALVLVALGGRTPTATAHVTIRAPLPLEGWVGDNGSMDIERTWAMSPQGDVLTYVGLDDAHRTVVFVRRLDSLTPEKIDGTEGVTSVFVSPDGAWVGMVRDNRLERVTIAGGEPIAIHSLDERDFWGASWGGSENRLVYAAGRTGLRSVSMQGGDVRVLTELDRSRNEGSHRLPHHVPGTRVLLFTIMVETSFRHEIWAIDLDTGERRYLVDGLAPSYLDSGLLVYARGEGFGRGALWAVPFDARSMVLGGEPQVIQASVGGREGSAYALARQGTLVYQPSQGQLHSELVVMLPGELPRVLAEDSLLEGPAISRDGSQVAVAQGSDVRNLGIWIHEVANASGRQFAPGGQLPLWDPDDGGITYMHAGVGLVNRRFDAPDELTTVVAHPQVIIPYQWINGSRDLLYLAVHPERGGALYVLPRGGEPRELTAAGPSGGSISPDGRWMAVCAWPSGVLVGATPDFTSATMVAPGGCNVDWGPDGLYYRENARLWVVEVTAGRASLRFGERRPVVDFGLPSRREYDVDATGRLAFVRARYDAPQPPVLLLNWRDPKLDPH